MKINIGIVGYGNLGKSVEKLLQNNENFNLIAIFSRRDITSIFDTKVEKFNNILNYKNKIDIMILCGGSLSDIEKQTTKVIKYFDCINTFDTHSKIYDEKLRLEKIAKKYKHRLIMSCGWDPGIFSVIRALFYSLNKDFEPITFWGKGISLGHSEAIRKIDGVLDSVQFTVPNIDAVKLAKKGNKIETYEHNRECYVATLDNSKISQQKIENDIKNIPNYFKGQPTTVKFVSKEKIEKYKKSLSHRGEVIYYFKNNNENFGLDFSVTMSSNPDFTSCIVISYLNAIINLKRNKLDGVFLPIEIPISYLYPDYNQEEIIKKFS